MEKLVIVIVNHTIVVPSNKINIPTGVNNYAPILLLAFAAAATYKYSKTHARKVKREMAWQVIKNNMFKRKGKLGVFWLILLICSPLIIVLFLLNWVMGLILLTAILCAVLYGKYKKNKG
jgi:hypothetical protein